MHGRPRWTYKVESRLLELGENALRTKSPESGLHSYQVIVDGCNHK